MGDNNNMKIKLLKLVEYLKTESSKDNPKSTNEIIAYLESTGTSSERRTLYQDMEFLAENGIDVVKTKKSKENAYYIDSNALSLAELKILIDAVQAANFITDSKTAALVEKLTDLAGIRKREILNENIIFYNNHKHTNEDIFDNIEITRSHSATSTSMRSFAGFTEKTSKDTTQTQLHLFIVKIITIS